MKPHAIFEYLATAGRKLVVEADALDAKLREADDEDGRARHVAIVPLVEQVRAVLPLVEGLSVQFAGAESEEKRTERECFVQKLAADLLIKSMATIATPKQLGAGADVTFKFLEPAICVELARKVFDEGAKAWGEPGSEDAKLLAGQS